MMWLCAVMTGVVWACLASFAGVVAERVPRGESINGRSHCVCGRQLDALQNIPVLGWCVSRGRASCCGAVIPRRYVVSEMVSLVAGFVVGLLAGAFLPVPVAVGFLVVASAGWTFSAVRVLRRAENTEGPVVS